MRTLWCVMALMCSSSILAQVVIDGFQDPDMDARYRALIHTIRCMNCQNQSIAESPATQAGDIRQLAHDLMAEGQSDQEIRNFLTSRYGDFISYKPPLKPTTWLLWGAPFLLLGGGAFVFVRILQKRLQQPLDTDEATG